MGSYEDLGSKILKIIEISREAGKGAEVDLLCLLILTAADERSGRKPTRAAWDIFDLRADRLVMVR